MYALSVTLLFGLSLYFENDYKLYLGIYRIAIVIEFLLISVFFSMNIKSTALQRLLLFSNIPFIILSIFDYINSNSNELTFYPQIAESIVFIFSIIYIFYEKMETELKVPIYQTYFFWISIAFLMYFGGNFFLFLFSKTSLQKSEDFYFQYSLILGSFTILKNILLCVAVFQSRYSVKKQNPSDEALKQIELDFFDTTDNKLTFP